MGIMTAVRHEIPVTTVVFHNRQWGAEKKNQIEFYNRHFVAGELDNQTFATVRLRMKPSRNRGSRDTSLAMVSKLLQSVQTRWRRIKYFQRLELVVSNVKFQDGEQVDDQTDRNEG